MRFELSEDQQLLRASTRDFFAKASPLEHGRRVMEQEPNGFEAPQWRQLADMGYVGLVVPAELGGQGLGAVELAVVCEEAGPSVCRGRSSTGSWARPSWVQPADRRPC